RPIPRPSLRRPETEHLVRGDLPVEDVTAREPEHPLEVRGGEDLLPEDGVADVRTVCVEGIEDPPPPLLPPALPRAVPEMVRRVLREQVHRVLPGRRHVVIQGALKVQLEEGL